MSQAGEGDRFSRAMRDPVSVFGRPQDVLEEASWSADQKRRVLKQWRLDAERLDAAAGENMAGGEPSRLQEVVQALEHLAEQQPG